MPVIIRCHPTPGRLYTTICATATVPSARRCDRIQGWRKRSKSISRALPAIELTVAISRPRSVAMAHSRIGEKMEVGPKLEGPAETQSGGWESDASALSI